jgi:hypothetical protein
MQSRCCGVRDPDTVTRTHHTHTAHAHSCSFIERIGEEATETAPNLANETRSNAPLFR